MITGNVIVFTQDDVEQDITLIMPNGKKVLLQYRAYSDPDMPTIDICLDDPVYVTNYSDDEMTPAKYFGEGTMENVVQLSFSLPHSGEDQ